MNGDDEVQSLLEQIEQNQRTALELQREQLDLAKDQLERSNRSVQESIELQRSAVARQSQITKILMPIVGVLLLLIVYLMIRWDIF